VSKGDIIYKTGDGGVAYKTGDGGVAYKGGLEPGVYLTFTGYLEGMNGTIWNGETVLLRWSAISNRYIFQAGGSLPRHTVYVYQLYDSTWEANVRLQWAVHDYKATFWRSITLAGPYVYNRRAGNGGDHVSSVEVEEH